MQMQNMYNKMQQILPPKFCQNWTCFKQDIMKNILAYFLLSTVYIWC